MAPTRASSQRPGLWKPLAPHALRAGFEATPGGGAFYGKTYSFDALSLTARSSFDSFDASSARSMLFASSASNDCECTNTLAHNNLPTSNPAPASLQCRHSVRPRPARPMLTAPPCTRRRPVCRMSTSRGSGNDFAARPAQQPQHLHGAPIIMRVQHPARGRRTEVSSMLQHVQ